MSRREAGSRLHTAGATRPAGGTGHAVLVHGRWTAAANSAPPVGYASAQIRGVGHAMPSC